VTKDDGTPYAVFTPFSKVWRRTGWDLPVDAPGGDFRWAGDGAVGVESRPLGDSTRSRFRTRELRGGGRAAAHDRWADFLPDGVDDYPDLRNLPGVAGTSRLSPSLKWGTIHPRQLLADLDASGAGSKGHTVFSSELAWREFYADVLFQQPRTAWENLNRRWMPCRSTPMPRRGSDSTGGRRGDRVRHRRRRDAQLAATGWMHNRVRMIVASFLVKDLHLPWQWGARWFMQHLIDGDLASNNHGWQWAAGTGTDAAPYFRVFNPHLQQERYDPDGEYVARWVPEPVEPMLDHHAERDEALAAWTHCADPEQPTCPSGPDPKGQPCPSGPDPKGQPVLPDPTPKDRLTRTAGSR
jgi:deoxyribodipyrimidine photo-lyase